MDAELKSVLDIPGRFLAIRRQVQVLPELYEERLPEEFG